MATGAHTAQRMVELWFMNSEVATILRKVTYTTQRKHSIYNHERAMSVQTWNLRFQGWGRGALRSSVCPLQVLPSPACILLTRPASQAP